jgi:hypothetical protein
MSDYRKLLPTACAECIIDVTGWHDSPNLGTVYVGLISSHDADHFRSWRGKLQRVLLALRGESYPSLMFVDREEVESFLVTLRAAGDVAFSQ